MYIEVTKTNIDLFCYCLTARKGQVTMSRGKGTTLQFSDTHIFLLSLCHPHIPPLTLPITIFMFSVVSYLSILQIDLYLSLYLCLSK